MANEKKKYEALLEDMENKFDFAIEGLTALKEDFRELRKFVGEHEESLTDHELRIKTLEKAS
jgi:predicted  nucleic acid-binding Zn-ribbon protein